MQGTLIATSQIPWGSSWQLGTEDQELNF
jgi:hypothetical protein